MSAKSKSPNFSLELSLRFLKSSKEIESVTNISVDEWKVIAQIYPNRTIGQIAKLTQMSKTKIQNVVQLLMENGIVEIISDNKDLGLTQEKSLAQPTTYKNTDSAQYLLEDWYVRVVKNQQAHYLLSSEYRNLHYWLGIPTILFSGVIGSTLLTSNDNPTLKTILGTLSLVITCITALQTFLRPSEQAEKHRLAAAQLGGIRREIDKLRAFPIPKAKQKALLEKIKEQIDKNTQEAPDLPTNIWSRLNQKDEQLSLINKLIARIRSL